MQKLTAAFLCGILLFSAFPPLECALLAWLALVPLIYLCFHSGPGRSFWYGFLAGIVFWLASISWLTHVSFIGWIFVSLYCSLYHAFFALIVSWWYNLMYRNFKDVVVGSPLVGDRSEKGRAQARPLHLMILFGVPAIWVGLEYARSHFLTGFPWNLLGISQYSCGPIIQCAEWGGVYLVSYLIVMGNTAIALYVIPHLPNRLSCCSAARLSRAESRERAATAPRSGALQVSRALRTAFPLLIFFLVISLVLAFGKWRQNNLPPVRDSIRIAAIQLNVPQEYKWSEDWANDIYRRLRKTAAEICWSDLPDLIVWPETALPDFVSYSEPSRELVNETLRYGVPLLAGSMDYEMLPGKTNYYNSSFLFLPGEHEAQTYIKRHLVVFGEYVPFARYFPFLRSITGIEDDFTPGTENVVLRLKNRGQKFSVLICFEDILPYLARECVLGGARLLINQTNDAWFDPSWASRQHMTHCVFRCIENRVACLRATNTGLTCLIDRCGRIRSMLLPLGSRPREPEILRMKAAFSPEKMPLTFYTRHGDLFALGCAAFSLPLFLGALLNIIGSRWKIVTTGEKKL